MCLSSWILDEETPNPATVLSNLKSALDGLPDASNIDLVKQRRSIRIEFAAEGFTMDVSPRG